MKKYLLFLIAITSTVLSSYSQEVKLNSKWSGQDLVIDSETSGYGDYSVSIKFTNLLGYRCTCDNEYPIIIRKGSQTNICKLVYISGSGGSPSYTYQYAQGRFDAKPDMDYPYLLPASEGKKLKAAPFSNIETKLGRAVEDSVLGVYFYCSGTDTASAVRSGTVISIKEAEKNAVTGNNGVSYYNAASRCIIKVEHKDGSFAQYTFVTPVKSLLKEGDRVIAGQAVAVFDGNEENRAMGISIGYLTFTKNKDFKYRFFLPKFLSQEGQMVLKFGETYTVSIPKEIIGKELTKGEKKRLNL